MAHTQLSTKKKGNVPSLGTVLGWIAARLSPEEPPRQRPCASGKAPRLGVVSRSRLGSWWQARSAVAAGVRLEEFLRWRLARYLGRLPLAAAELRAALAMEEGLQDDAAPTLLAAYLGEAGADRLRVRADSEVALAKQEIASAEAELTRVQARLEAQEALVGTCVRNLEAAVAGGGAAIRGAEWATPDQLGRPLVPRPWALIFCGSLAAALVIAQIVLLMMPFLRMFGLDPHPGRELAFRPIEAVPCLLLALGTTGTLLVLAHFVLRRGSKLPGTAARRRSVWTATATTTVGAAGIGALVWGDSAASFAALGLLNPFATVWLLHHVEQLAAARAPILEKARAWDQEFRIAMAERIRHEELLERAREERDRIAQQRDAVQAELAAAVRHAIEAERGYAATSTAERSRLSRLANSLNAALERDRYAFIHEAARCGGRELLVDVSPRWALPPSVEPRRGPTHLAAAPPALARFEGPRGGTAS